MSDEVASACEDASARRQLSCIRCGYDLRGLDEAGNCPECGTAIEESLHGDLLRYADPDWVRTIMRGLRVLAWGATILAWSLGIVLIGTVFFLLVALIPRASWSINVPGFVIMFATWIGVLASFVLLSIGIWLVTVPEPREDAGYTPARSRIVARWSLLVLGLAIGHFAAVMSIPALMSSTIARSTGFGGLILAFSLVLLSVMAHLMNLARRAQAEEALQKKGRLLFRTLCWLLPAAAVFMALNASLRAAAVAAGAAPATALSMPVVISCASSLLIFGAIIDGIRALVWGGRAHRAIRVHLETDAS